VTRGHRRREKKEEAEKTYKKGLDTDGIPGRYKSRIAALMEAMKQKKANPVSKE
jgi:hypothetical protein